MRENFLIKIVFKLTLISLMLVQNISFALTVPDGGYLGLFGQGSYVKGIDFIFPLQGARDLDFSLRRRGFSVLTNRLGAITFAAGGGFGAQAGYRWCGFRLEGELMFNITPYKQIRIDGRRFKQGQQAIVVPNVGPTAVFPYNMSGNLVFGTAFLNVAYDLYFTSDANWIPYAGAGIGYSYVHNQYRINYNSVNPVTRANLSTQVFHVTYHHTVVMGQGFAGIAYQMDDFFSVGLDARYIVSQQVRAFDRRLTVGTINLTFNHWFN